MPIAYVFFLPVEEKKWRKKKRMSRKGVALSDNIIVSLFTMGC